MNCLLDTNAFIWWHTDQPVFSSPATQALHNRDNALFLSVVSIWEIAIKMKLGKFSLIANLMDAVEKEARVNGLRILPIHANHAIGTYDLPLHHKDPFDRLLIAQAQAERMTIITADSVFVRYGVKIVW